MVIDKVETIINNLFYEQSEMYCKQPSVYIRIVSTCKVGMGACLGHYGNIAEYLILYSGDHHPMSEH